MTPNSVNSKHTCAICTASPNARQKLRHYWEKAQKHGKFVCPVCDSKMMEPAKDYNICCECMVEFGYDDAGMSIEELRRRYREHKRI